MNIQIDHANVKPGEQPPVPTTRDELLIEALRSANRVSLLLNEIAAWAHSQSAWGTEKEGPLTALEDLLARRFSDCSGVHLFIAAHNLNVNLPPDIDGCGEDDEEDHYEI
jgi:hypothetical protein